MKERIHPGRPNEVCKMEWVPTLFTLQWIYDVGLALLGTSCVSSPVVAGAPPPQHSARLLAFVSNVGISRHPDTQTHIDPGCLKNASSVSEPPEPFLRKWPNFSLTDNLCNQKLYVCFILL